MVLPLEVPWVFTHFFLQKLEDVQDYIWISTKVSNTIKGSNWNGLELFHSLGGFHLLLQLNSTTLGGTFGNLPIIYLIVSTLKRVHIFSHG